MNFVMVLGRITIGINNSPKKDEEDEKGRDASYHSHIEHLIEFVSNKDSKYSKQEQCNDPSPNKDGINIESRSLARVAHIIPSHGNQDENHDIKNGNIQHFVF
jgi:hypothetical protein